MTSRQREAHLRMLSTMQPRTVQARPDMQVFSTKRGGRERCETIRLNKRITALHAKGLNNVQIADELGVSEPTVSRHLKGAVKALLLT